MQNAAECGTFASAGDIGRALQIGRTARRALSGADYLM